MSRRAHRRHRAHLLRLRAELTFLGITRHGDHDQSDHGAWATGGGGSGDSRPSGMTNMSQAEYSETYDVNDATTFDETNGGAVVSMTDGSVQISYESGDNVAIFADLTQAEGDNIVSHIDDYTDADIEDYYDLGMDEDPADIVGDGPGGLVDWKSVGPDTDLVVGIDGNAEISLLASGTPGLRIDLGTNPTAFVRAMTDELANAYNAEIYG